MRKFEDFVTILKVVSVNSNKQMERSMKIVRKHSFLSVLALTLAFAGGFSIRAQNNFEILNQAETAKVVPASFYFAGQSAPTQMRNAAAARIGKDRFIVAGMVDTSGYSSEIAAKYEGFFITDSPISIGGETLGAGAYGFGFSSDGKVNILDLASKPVLSAVTQNDSEMKRPRPLQMISEAKGIRFYKGKNYVLISPK
jgi:hypothetical protein